MFDVKHINYERLADILSYCRADDSESEAHIIATYIDSVDGMCCDTFGNRYLRIGESDTLFACHTDTVHEHHKGIKRQHLSILLPDNGPGLLMLHPDEKGVLGADDGAGIELMLCLIEAGIEGLYVFHRAEEGGGQGSGWLVANAPDIYAGISKCISFDRKGVSSVITHQAGGRCCSDAFGIALAAQLGYRLDTKGLFTDSAQYTEVIPECTNLSVGYYREHTSSESLDVMALDDLVGMCKEIDWQALPVERVPKPDRYSKPSYGTPPTTRAGVEELVYYEPDEAVDMLCEYLMIEEQVQFSFDGEPVMADAWAEPFVD